MPLESHDRLAPRRLDAILAILLMALALGVRVHAIAFNSLSEDETAKWFAIQQYRQGHFAGVNSEHPIMLKMLAWGGLTVGESWNRAALRHNWPTMPPEGWLRFPNAALGAATAAVLYLLCRLAMAPAGAFAAGFFWAVSPLPIALNRLLKEETALTFFTLLACYFYWRGKRAEAQTSTRRWLDLAACAFGLATAAQYIIHLFGLNQLAWHIAGRRGLDHKPLRSLNRRLLLLMGLAFLLANPVILSPVSLNHILHWLHHDGIRHTGYAFDGNLYLNFPSRLLAGVPWYFYLWMVVVKTPIPILIAIIAGSVLLLRDRKTVASCLFLSFGVVQLIGLSLSGAKWLRYSLPLLPFLYLAGGYAVQAGWAWLRKRKAPSAFVGAGVVVLLGWLLVQLHAWAPYYPMYLNSIGGGASNLARYFAPDEISTHAKSHSNFVHLLHPLPGWLRPGRTA
jgi:4-amino-4-deoxy-L-arabinose transferase-like glycosyltransferase